MVIERDEAAQFADIERRLRGQFAAVPEAVVAQELRAAAEALSEARIRTYVPVLLQRRVAESLRQYA